MNCRMMQRKLTRTIALMWILHCCLGPASPAALPLPADPTAAVKAGLEDARQKTLAEIAAWKDIGKQVETRTVDAAPEWLAAAARVMTSLRAEIEARQALCAADLAVLQAAAGSPSQAIYPERPFNDLTAETNYADRMLAITQPQAKAAPAEAERMHRIGNDWKASAGADAARILRIDRWLELVDEEAALAGRTVELYGVRVQPGWYDRACLVAKFDAPMLRVCQQAARRGINPGPKEALLDTQTKAIVAVHQAGKATYQAMSAFHTRMTRESPLVQPPAATQTAIPTPLWDLERLGHAPQHRWLDDKSSVRQLLYRGEPYQGKPTDVFAYYATPGSLAGDPALDKNLPALILIHGGGDRAFRDWVTFWAKQGYAAIAMDLAGCGPNVKGEYDKLFKPARLLRGGPGQDGKRKILDIDLPVTDQWPYHAVANVIRAHSLIRTLPGVDPERTGVAGISWGGYVTCIVAGVDLRFKAAMAFYGCGFLAENSVWKDTGLFDQLTGDQRRRWTALWDPSIYAPRIQIPLFCVTGARDFAYPLEAFAKTYALPKGERLFRITPDMGHGAQFLTSTPEAVVFMDSILRGGKPLPAVRTPQIVPDGVTAAVTGDDIVGAQFHYTTAPGPNPTREWVTTQAVLKDGRLTAPRPPGTMKIGYFTVTDRSGRITSSEPVIPDVAVGTAVPGRP